MILSASGFRKVFAISGNEEDSGSEISYEDMLVCAGAAKSFFDNKLSKGSCVLMGRDTRPTGKTICRIIGNSLKALGVEVKYLGVCAVDQLLCFSRREEFDSFVYVSASHNPIGHNGFKFGCKGGVYNKDEVSGIISSMKEFLDNPALAEDLLRKSEECIVAEDEKLFEKSLEDYRNFVLKYNPNSEVNVGIVIDFNGSARSVSIDETLLKGLGVKVCVLNDKPGNIVHGIIPEGMNLDACRQLLEQKHREDSSFVLGYMPDCDGDRGNIVFIDEYGNARIMPAQTVFALCVYSTLKTSSEKGEKNLAVAVNDSTSMRINEIASSFGAKVFRAEVGEANAVNLADYLRGQGFNVPILGEGSNGGNISYPSRVRDPMSTILCILRLLKDDSICSAISKLPEYISTETQDPAAVLHLKTENYRLLKNYYEESFDESFEKNKEKFKRPDVKYRELQTDGIVERCESGNGDRGGLKMVFSSEGKDFAFIWMRPSGTEPLFRIMADVKGSDKELHDFLISWQKEMILTAQEKVLLLHSL